MYIKSDPQLHPVLLQHGVEFVVQVGADRHVGEHAVQLVGELVAARLLQPVDHRLLRVHALRLLVYQALREHARVELLEHVLVVDVLEDYDALRQLLVHLNQHVIKHYI